MRALETGERSQTAARGGDQVGETLAASWGLRGGSAREAGALIQGPGHRGELLPGVKGAGSSPQLSCP